MKVLLFTDADVFAGTERHMLDLALSLREEGVRVLVAAPSPSVLEARAAESGLDFIAIAKGGLIDRAAIVRLRRLLKSGQVDIVHSHNGRTAFSGALATLVARRGRLVATQHFLHPHHVGLSGIKGALSKLTHGWVSGRCARLVAISRAVRNAMLERHEARDERISLVFNGISEPDASALEPPDLVRARFGIAPESPLVVCVARLEAEKDIAILLDAMSLVVREMPHARCLIAGQGSLRAALEEQAARLKLGQSVVMAGFVPDALSLVGAGDVFVLPSREEPFGLVLLEAMALALPVIATRAGGPAEIVEDERTGRLVAPGDGEVMASEMALKILSILEDKARARAMGRAGRARFEQLFTRAHMGREMMRVYQEACVGQPPSTSGAPSTWGARDEAENARG